MSYLGGPVFPLTNKDPNWEEWGYDSFDEKNPLRRNKKIGLDSWSWNPYGGNPDYKDLEYRPGDYQGEAYQTAPWIYQERPNPDPRYLGVQASVPSRVDQFLNSMGGA